MSSHLLRQRDLPLQELQAVRSAALPQQGPTTPEILPIGMHHFAEALQHVQASVKPDDLVKYMNMPDPNLLAKALA